MRESGCESMEKCKHKWVDMEDGSLDKLCVRCRKFAMQAVLELPKTINEATGDVSMSTSLASGSDSKIQVSKIIQDNLERRMNSFNNFK